MQASYFNISNNVKLSEKYLKFCNMFYLIKNISISTCNQYKNFEKLDFFSLLSLQSSIHFTFTTHLSVD